MANFNAAITELQAGRCVRRGRKSNRNGSCPLYLKTCGKRKYLCAGGVSAELDWDDIIATDWQAVDGTWRDFHNQHQDLLEGLRLSIAARNRTRDVD